MAATRWYLYHAKEDVYWGEGYTVASALRARMFASKYAAEQFAREHALDRQGWNAYSEYPA